MLWIEKSVEKREAIIKDLIEESGPVFKRDLHLNILPLSSVS